MFYQKHRRKIASLRIGKVTLESDTKQWHKTVTKDTDTKQWHYAVTRDRGTREWPNFLWDRFWDFFGTKFSPILFQYQIFSDTFLVPNFLRDRFRDFFRNQIFPRPVRRIFHYQIWTGRHRYRDPHQHQNSDNKFWGRHMRKGYKRWYLFEKVKWESLETGNRDQIFPRSIPRLFFGIKYFPRPIPRLFSVPNFFQDFFQCQFFLRPFPRLF